MEPIKNTQAAQAEVIAQLARDGVKRHAELSLQDYPVGSGIAPRLVWPDKTITNLETALPKPLRKRGDATLHTADSFITYVNDHKRPDTHIVGDADEKSGRFVARLDYMERNTENAATPECRQSSWAEHTARLPLQATPEWARWFGICGSELEQRRFAEFLEDNAADVVTSEAEPKAPTALDLMQVATTLQVKSDVKFASAVNLQNGQIQLTYEELIDGSWGGATKMAVPQAFFIAVAPFRGGPRYSVKIRLRYRASSGKASFRLEMERPHKVIEAAFNDIKAHIQERTGLPVLVGTLNPQVI
jgi:uncharacterized protein YfdQ (DUF2303 family)